MVSTFVGGDPGMTGDPPTEAVTITSGTGVVCYPKLSTWLNTALQM